ncbi:uncharacterized protein K441DRAFT_663112 [Cenococcum geophilum 1.58]|uniref:uncharacterized protein n=1 Tax=Cenococcum geophilum 1.58 TaxID=794803 RepID=UPI00358EF4DA|nr:hypothetical protein K441DRAFT_663112 [Cenococcum geophilum 1.58]
MRMAVVLAKAAAGAEIPTAPRPNRPAWACNRRASWLFHACLGSSHAVCHILPLFHWDIDRNDTTMHLDCLFSQLTRAERDETTWKERAVCVLEVARQEGAREIGLLCRL